MYKMIAIDIDGTLINDQRQVTDGTKTALAAAIEQGVIVTLATGRMYVSARSVAEQLGINVPLITYQGSLVKNALDGRVLYERCVPEEAMRTVFTYCRENGLHLQTYTDDKLYVQEDNETARNYSDAVGVPYIVCPDFQALAGQASAKLLLIDEPEILDRAAGELKGQLGPLAHITKSKPHYLEITHAEGTKGHALRHLAAEFGFDLTEVIGIGDSWNDREMLEAAGLGVAMGNAVDALKQIADYITLSNNEDGIKHVVEKFILHTA